MATDPRFTETSAARVGRVPAPAAPPASGAQTGGPRKAWLRFWRPPEALPRRDDPWDYPSLEECAGLAAVTGGSGPGRRSERHGT